MHLNVLILWLKAQVYYCIGQGDLGCYYITHIFNQVRHGKLSGFR